MPRGSTRCSLPAAIRAQSWARHTVRIGTEGYVLGPDGTTEFVAEAVPAAYNTQSTLAADVQPGQNTFNFDLSSKPAGSE